MCKLIPTIVFSFFATLAAAQQDTDPKTRCGKESGGDIALRSKGNGTAELVVSNMSMSWNPSARPADGLYCLAKVGPGWAGNRDNTVFDQKKALYCGRPQNKEVKIDFKWPDHKPGHEVETMGFVPVSIYPDGKIFCWDQKPRPQGEENSYMKSNITKRVEGVIALHRLSNGRVIWAIPEEAKLLKD